MAQSQVSRKLILNKVVSNMGCRNCGDKPSTRHAPTVMVQGDIDEQKSAIEKANEKVRQTFAPDEDDPIPSMPSNPYEAFEEAKALTYEDIARRDEEQLRRAAEEVELMYAQMTDAMRQFHVMSLLRVANFENMAMPGVTPDQAIMALKTALEREDFKNINELYPRLKQQVDKRCQELLDKRILL